MDGQELIPHLFRTEYRKIVSVLCKRFGFEQIETAEDIAGDTFMAAVQIWPVKGLPPNPVAWLYNVAKNKARNYLHRNMIFENKIAGELKNNQDASYEDEIDLSPQNINDSQLQMMFAICHPSLPPEAQIGLSLRILCGFGIEEIASAFLTNKETINKRLYRAKEKLREGKIEIAVPGPSQIDSRLTAVLSTIYLLFNEGYYSLSQDQTLRQDLCLEAIRLCTMLAENNATNKPPVNALLSLMYFHASRFDARLDKNGGQILYEEQDISLWNDEYISKGAWFLHLASTGDQVSKYHLEAAIAWWNTQKADTVEKWQNMLQLCDRLLLMEYSPIAALNRVYALSKVEGKLKAIPEAERLALTDNQFYFALLGELYTGIDDIKALQNLQKAFSIARTTSDKQTIQKKMDAL